jgi:two-component system, LytTR family, response regulator
MNNPAGLRVLVVDDEPLARRRLVALLRRRPEVGRITEAEDGDAALAALRHGDVDVAFLDVQMPGRDGIAVARAIGAGQLPVVVFVTAFDQYAVTAFELAAVDYLLKPFDDERFGEAFDRASRRLAGDSLATFRDRLAALLGGASSNAPASAGHITVEKSGRMVVLSLTEVDWVRAAGNYVELHARGDTYLLRGTLARAADRLPSPPFLRTHRAVLVNADRIAHIDTLATGEHSVVLRDGTRLPLSRRYRRRLPTLGE